MDLGVPGVFVLAPSTLPALLDKVQLLSGFCALFCSQARSVCWSTASVLTAEQRKQVLHHLRRAEVLCEEVRGVLGALNLADLEATVAYLLL